MERIFELVAAAVLALLRRDEAYRVSTYLSGRLDAYHTIGIGWAVCVLNLLLCVSYLFMEYIKARRRIIVNLGISFIPIIVGVLLDYISVWSGLSNDTKWLRSCFGA